MLRLLETMPLDGRADDRAGIFVGDGADSSNLELADPSQSRWSWRSPQAAPPIRSGASSPRACTPQQVAAITGHSLKTVHRILERYLARTRGLAEQAIFNFENSSRTKFANQLQTGTDANATAKGKGAL
jgi:hypothetical protein